MLKIFGIVLQQKKQLHRSMVFLSPPQYHRIYPLKIAVDHRHLQARVAAKMAVKLRKFAVIYHHNRHSFREYRELIYPAKNDTFSAVAFQS